ncbi:MAG: hypothetical protein ACLR1G_00110 [Alistipes indistinctus]
MKHPAFVCCAVSFLFLGATSVQAQETSDLTDVHFYPPSAVSMMKYIDYPVSHRTGIPKSRSRSTPSDRDRWSCP